MGDNLPEPTLRDLVEQRFADLKDLLDERRESDRAVLNSHNELIKQMREQAAEAQRQLDKLTDTYATKDNLENLESLIDSRLLTIEKILSTREASKRALRGAWVETRGTILAGFAILGVLLALASYLAQN